VKSEEVGVAKNNCLFAAAEENKTPNNFFEQQLFSNPLNFQNMSKSYKVTLEGNSSKYVLHVTPLENHKYSINSTSQMDFGGMTMSQSTSYVQGPDIYMSLGGGGYLTMSGMANTAFVFGGHSYTATSEGVFKDGQLVAACTEDLYYAHNGKIYAVRTQQMVHDCN
jgi:hypothetical protein